MAECYPCMLDQAIRAAVLSGVKGDALVSLMREASSILSEMDPGLSPPEAAAPLYLLVSEISGVPDPYRDVREESNAKALEIVEKLKEEIREDPRGLEKALAFAVAGNAVDFGARSLPMGLEDSLRRMLEGGLLVDDRPELRKDLESAEKLLYICDNAGEIAFDRLLCETILEEYPGVELTVAVRGGPMINDALLPDALQVGMDRLGRVITTGQALAGVSLEKASSELRDCFDEADIIVAKGQGNFETLEDRAENIYFLFQVKCDCVSRYLGVERGAGLVLRGRSRKEKGEDGPSAVAVPRPGMHPEGEG